MRRSLKTCCAPLLATLLVAGCTAVQVKPDPDLPAPLLKPMPANVGLVLGSELSGYRHEETRQGGDWEIDLGPGHVEEFEQIFRASFSGLQVFPNLDAARAATGLQAIFQPGIEQYSFTTARDTSGGYWAVTIRYRIGVMTPAGELADSLTLTGYGSARDKGGSRKSLENATLSAMRDAAAKFLVQLPRQSLATQLRAGQLVQVGSATAVAVDAIELVPIEP
jgi:hypothetical protein